MYLELWEALDHHYKFVRLLVMEDQQKRSDLNTQHVVSLAN